MAPGALKPSRLVLGTAQFGTPYGIANKTGQPDQQTVTTIIARAWEEGVHEFDTGQAYGESEKNLGVALKSLGVAGEARVTSKLHPEVDHWDSAEVRRCIQKTISHLGTPKLYALMLHREALLDDWNHGLSTTLHSLAEEGLVQYFGVSVYRPQRALQALETDGITLLQVPANLLDRRFEQKGVFAKRQKSGKQIYLRSVFLQGLLLMSVGDIPGSLKFARPVIERVINLSRNTGFSVKQLALGFVKSAYPVHKVIFGCETIQQLEDNLNLWRQEIPEEIVDRIRKEFQNISETILNPVFWNQRSKAQDYEIQTD